MYIYIYIFIHTVYILKHMRTHILKQQTLSSWWPTLAGQTWNSGAVWCVSTAVQQQQGEWLCHSWGMWVCCQVPPGLAVINEAEACLCMLTWIVACCLNVNGCVSVCVYVCVCLRTSAAPWLTLEERLSSCVSFGAMFLFMTAHPPVIMF